MTKKKRKIWRNRILLHMFFITFIGISLIPIFYALTISVSSSNALLSSDFSFIPSNITLGNYATLIQEKPLFLWFGNTLILSLSTLILALSLAIPTAYILSRLRFKGRFSIFRGLILLNAFPAILSMFALYRLFSIGPISLINTRFGLTLIYAGTMVIFAILNLKGYFDTIPREIEDAARIDGGNEWQVITQIVLPLAKPAMVVTSVLILIFVWNEYIFAVTFMTGSSNYTLAAGLFSLQAGEISGSWPLFTAAAILTSLPILIIFLFVQKYMISGLTVGGVKG